MYAIKNVSLIPRPDSLKKVCKCLAILDCILMPEWEYRYFSFNKKWDKKEMMASMRNGSGEEYFIHFCENGVAIKLYSKDNTIAINYQDLLKQVPKEFASFKTENAFNFENTTYLLWIVNGQTEWSVLPKIKTEIPLLGFVVSGPKYYYDWAVDYYEKKLNFGIIEDVFANKPINEEMIKKLNKDITLEDIKDDIDGIGYPFE
jgi:hypothetical protein